MFRATIDLLHRVGAIVGEYREFYDAARAWYSDVSLANQAVRLFLARSSSGARVALVVNGQQLAGEATVVAPNSQSLRWTLVPALMRADENEIVVSVESQPGRRLYLHSVSVAKEGAPPQQVVTLNRRAPDPTAYLAVIGSHGTEFDGDVWVVQPGGSVTVRLRLAARVPVALVLSLLNETVTPRAVFDRLKEVAERVQKIRSQLAQERRRVGRSKGAHAERLEREIADLDAYLELHVRQIEPAFRGADSGTLQEIIARTGDPDRLVEDVLAPPREPKPRSAARGPAASAEPRPKRPRPEGSKSRPEPKSSSGLSCLAALAGILLVLAGLGYAGWMMVRPEPRAPQVEISSLTEGQSVAPGAPLQVWVLAVDPAGVESVALAVETGGGATVGGAPDPQRVTFPPKTGEPGSTVFTVNVGALRGPSGTLTLTATMVTRDGKSLTDRRVVTVGGNAEDLQWEIVPKQPKPTDLLVTVVVRMVNPRPGAKIGYTLRGTDGHTQPFAGEAPLEVGPDGTVRFRVPSSHDGVIDRIEAWIEGTAVRRKTQYEFQSVER